MGTGPGERQGRLVSRRLCGDAAYLRRRQENPTVDGPDTASLASPKTVAVVLRGEQCLGGSSRRLVSRGGSDRGALEGIAAATTISWPKSGKCGHVYVCAPVVDTLYYY